LLAIGILLALWAAVVGLEWLSENHPEFVDRFFMAVLFGASVLFAWAVASAVSEGL
jgi:uncharacterized membrane protein